MKNITGRVYVAGAIEDACDHQACLGKSFRQLGAHGLRRGKVLGIAVAAEEGSANCITAVPSEVVM